MEFPQPSCDSPIIPIVLAHTFGQKQSALHFVSCSELEFSIEHYIHLTYPTYSLLCPVPFCSAESPTKILHSAHQPRGDAGRQHQPDVRGGGLSDALRQVDDRPGGADQGGGDASGTQRAGGH